jgi:hypothetical protein
MSPPPPSSLSLLAGGREGGRVAERHRVEVTKVGEEVEVTRFTTEASDLGRRA